MKKYSTNYCFSNHNFVIQNLHGRRINNEFLPAVCILKNILQSGKPTLPSVFIQEKIGAIHKRKDFENSFALIDKKSPVWERIIRGDQKGNYFPAKKFECLISLFVIRKIWNMLGFFKPKSSLSKSSFFNRVSY